MESSEFELRSKLISLQEELTNLLEKFKDYEKNKKFTEQRMKVSKKFSGFFLEPYEDFEYRRTECENTIIWEYLDKAFIQWFVIEEEEKFKSLEEMFQRDCLVSPTENDISYDIHNYDHNHSH